MKSFISSVASRISKSLPDFMYSPPIETLGLNARALNALKKSDVHTLKDLKEVKDGLQFLPGIGAKTATHILEVLDKSF